jgi:hypothetical protein
MASFVGMCAIDTGIPAICFSTLHVGACDVLATLDDACPTSSGRYLRRWYHGVLVCACVYVCCVGMCVCVGEKESSRRAWGDGGDQLEC